MRFQRFMVLWAPTNKTLYEPWSTKRFSTLMFRLTYNSETLGSGECPTRQILDIDWAKSDVNGQLSCNPPSYGVADLKAGLSFSCWCPGNDELAKPLRSSDTNFFFRPSY